MVALTLLELFVRLMGLGIHGVMQEWARYATLLVHDERADYPRHPAGTSVVLQRVTMRFNSLGLRDEEPRIPKLPGTFRGEEGIPSYVQQMETELPEGA